MKLKIITIFLLLFTVLGSINAQRYNTNNYELSKNNSRKKFIGRLYSQHIIKIHQHAIANYGNLIDSSGVIDAQVTEIRNDSFIIDNKFGISYYDMEWLLNNRESYKIRLTLAATLALNVIAIGVLSSYEVGKMSLPITLFIATLLPMLPTSILLFSSAGSEVIYTNNYSIKYHNVKDIFRRQPNDQPKTNDIFQR